MMIRQHINNDIMRRHEQLLFAAEGTTPINIKSFNIGSFISPDNTILSRISTSVQIIDRHILLDSTSKRRLIENVMLQLKKLMIKYSSRKRTRLLELSFEKLKFTFPRNFYINESGMCVPIFKVISKKVNLIKREVVIKKSVRGLFVLLWHQSRTILKRRFEFWRTSTCFVRHILGRYFDEWNCWCSRRILNRLNLDRFVLLLKPYISTRIACAKSHCLLRWRAFCRHYKFQKQLRLIFQCWRLTIRADKQEKAALSLRCIRDWKDQTDVNKLQLQKIANICELLVTDEWPLRACFRAWKTKQRSRELLRRIWGAKIRSVKRAWTVWFEVVRSERIAEKELMESMDAERRQHEILMEQEQQLQEQEEVRLQHQHGKQGSSGASPRASSPRTRAASNRTGNRVSSFRSPKSNSAASNNGNRSEGGGGGGDKDGGMSSRGGGFVKEQYRRSSGGKRVGLSVSVEESRGDGEIERHGAGSVGECSPRRVMTRSPCSEDENFNFLSLELSESSGTRASTRSHGHSNFVRSPKSSGQAARRSEMSLSPHRQALSPYSLTEFSVSSSFSPSPTPSSRRASLYKSCTSKSPTRIFPTSKSPSSKSPARLSLDSLSLSCGSETVAGTSTRGPVALTVRSHNSVPTTAIASSSSSSSSSSRRGVERVERVDYIVADRDEAIRGPARAAAVSTRLFAASPPTRHSRGRASGAQTKATRNDVAAGGKVSAHSVSAMGRTVSKVNNAKVPVRVRSDMPATLAAASPATPLPPTVPFNSPASPAQIAPPLSMPLSKAELAFSLRLAMAQEFTNEFSGKGQRNPSSSRQQSRHR